MLCFCCAVKKLIPSKFLVPWIKFSERNNSFDTSNPPKGTGLKCARTLLVTHTPKVAQKRCSGLVLLHRENSQDFSPRSFSAPKAGLPLYGTSSMEKPMVASIGTLIGRFGLHLRLDSRNPFGCPALHRRLSGGDWRSLSSSSSGPSSRMPTAPVAIPRQRY